MENADTEGRLICCICKISNKLCTDFIIIGKSTADSSKKPLISVINHLLKATTSKHNGSVTKEDVVCNHCYHDLLEYDDLVMRLLSIQERFKQLLHSPSRNYESTTVSRNVRENDFPTFSSGNKLALLGSSEIEAFISEQLSPKEGLIEQDSIEAELLKSSPIQCSQCGSKFLYTKDLDEHTEYAHAYQNSFKCNVCHKAFRSDEYLELHMNIHEGKTENDCRYCPKRFSRKVNVIRHMQKHWNKQNFQCEKCGLRFSDYSNLYNHRLLHEAEEKPLICEICQQSCKTRRTYKKHLVTHKEDRILYTCEICGKKFVDKYRLKVHLLTHKKKT